MSRALLSARGSRTGQRRNRFSHQVFPAGHEVAAADERWGDLARVLLLMSNLSNGLLPTASTPLSTGFEREQLLDRLQSLRGVLSAFAHEATSARRHAARLRVENRRLLEEVRRLQRERSC